MIGEETGRPGGATQQVREWAVWSSLSFFFFGPTKLPDSEFKFM